MEQWPLPVTPEEFVEFWWHRASVQQIAREVGQTVQVVRAAAAYLRDCGVWLRRKPRVTEGAFRAAWEQSTTRGQVARRLGVPHGQVLAWERRCRREYLLGVKAMPVTFLAILKPGRN